MRHRHLLLIGLATATIAASCSSGADDSAAPTQTVTAEPSTTDAPTTVTPTVAPTTQAPTTTIDPAEARTIEQVNDYVAQAAAFDQAGADAQFPPGLTFAAGGAPGYSRYVFREHSEGVVPTLVEGPLDGTVRCQDETLPCSYLDLKVLAASGEPIPPELEMSAEELSTLVSQLDEVNAFAELHRDVNGACAEGFVSDRIQSANMGSHFYQPSWIGDGFFPSRPEILLYALADGTMPNGPVGQCVGGVWNGPPMKLVGTSFIIPPNVIGNEHPDAFAGPLDNWHIHYNLCRGNAQGRDTFIPRSECEAAGGNFSAALGWMIHAWVDPLHDNQLGVFGMWNSSIQPVMDASAVLETREVRGTDFPEVQSSR